MRHFRQTLMIVFLFLVFGVPLFLAWVTATKSHHLGRGLNHGELIDPPLNLKNLKGIIHQTSPVMDAHTKFFQGHWILLYVHPEQSCESSCKKMLYHLHQIHSATHKDSERVRRVILTFSGDDLKNNKRQVLLSKDYLGTLHWTVTPEAWKSFIQGNPYFKEGQGGLYLADPLGNVILYYSEKTEPMNIFKDLTRLLKLSKIG